MPQVTNRSLVGGMTACPVGRGTVYNAMLKVSATNRERAAKVNNSEGQRLDKVTKVMDKDFRYTEWKAGNEIDKTRASLRQLAAFQKVLHDDFSARNFFGPTSHSSAVTRPCPKSKVSNTTQPSQTAQSGKLDNKTETQEVMTRSDGRDVTIAKRIEQEEQHHSPINKSKKNSAPSTQNIQSFDDYHKELSEKADKILGYKSSIDISKKVKKHVEKRQNESKKSEVKFQMEAENQAILRHAIKEDNSQNNMTCFEDKNEAFESRFKISNQDTEETELERRRRERKERMTQRVYTRGFDMKTLHKEVERKMRGMDPVRLRRKLQQKLLDDSRDTVERLIDRNRLKFDSEVMRIKQHQNDTEPAGIPGTDLLPLGVGTEEKEGTTGEKLQPEQSSHQSELPGAELDGTVIGQDITQDETEQSSFVNPLFHKIPLF